MTTPVQMFCNIFRLRNMRALTMLTLATILAAPGAVAFNQSYDDEPGRLDVLSWIEESFIFSDEDPAPGGGIVFSHNFTVNQVHNHEVIESQTIFRIKQTGTVIQSQDGVWNITVEINGETLEDCHWFLETTSPGGFLNNDLVTYFTLLPVCDVALDANASTNNFTLRREIESGTPDDWDATIVSVEVVRQQIIQLEETTMTSETIGLEALELIAIVGMAAVGLVIWSRSTDFIIRFFGGGMVLATGIILVAINGSQIMFWLGMAAALVAAYTWVRQFWDQLTDTA